MAGLVVADHGRAKEPKRTFQRSDPAVASDTLCAQI